MSAFALIAVIAVRTAFVMFQFIRTIVDNSREFPCRITPKRKGKTVMKMFIFLAKLT